MILNAFADFKYLLIDSESSGNYRANNGIAFGLYQFTKSRIETVATYLGEAIPSIEWFLADSTMQDRFFLAHIELILAYIEKHNLLRFEGKIVKGKNKYPIETAINIYGMVAGAHLGGEWGMRDFLENGNDRKDSLGTYVSDYVAKFSNKMIGILEKKKTLTT